ncbi:ATP11 protein [Musa troglodytarum]|uniref:ATP11 protein n=1 Tax=Musa troglodytarum TaxID=320322 RepID=A0A9E7IHZ8_9LILI|nr:ATP11 protein [Musa troglodytarum]
MRSLLSRFSRLSRSSASSVLRSPLRHPSPPHPLFSLEHPIRESFPGDHLKWMSVGCRRGSKFATGFAPLQPKQLGSIIDLERAKNCSPEELVSVWDDVKFRSHTYQSFVRMLLSLVHQFRYHIGRGHIGTSLKAKLYHLLDQRSITCRHFVIPLWRGSGYTNMFVQVQMPHMLFTGLEDYKARGTQASPYFTVTHYTEYADSKDVVLIRGDVVFASKLSDSEAKWLLETAQSFYLTDVRYKLVERFNKETREFEFKDVLRALEMPVL